MGLLGFVGLCRFFVARFMMSLWLPGGTIGEEVTEDDGDGTSSFSSSERKAPESPIVASLGKS